MKRQIRLDEYDFTDGNLSVYFMLDDGKYREDIINENTFQEYIEKSGSLEFFEDCWDGYSESHYTRDYNYDYDDWRDEFCEKDDILDFLYYYYKTIKLPEVIDE